MFVRTTTTPNSPRCSVQLVEAVRDGVKLRQRIVRHIGVAMDEDELERVRQLGEYVKAKLEDERQPSLSAPEMMVEPVIRLGRQGDGKQELAKGQPPDITKGRGIPPKSGRDCALARARSTVKCCQNLKD